MSKNKKKMTQSKYQQMCNDIGSDFVVEYAELLHDDMLYMDSASGILDYDEDGVAEYLKGLGVSDIRGRLADDIYSATMRANRK